MTKEGDHLSNEEKLRIAAEVLRGERPRSDLEKYGIEIGPWRLDDDAKSRLLDEMRVDDEDPSGPAHVQAHRHSSRHRDELLGSDRCGCFHCLAIYPPGEIQRWTDEGQTALCPKCTIDSVIGAKSGYLIDIAFLKEMQAHWFSAT